MLRVVIDIEYLYEVVDHQNLFLTVPLPTPEGPERTISNPFSLSMPYDLSKLFFYYLNIISYQTKDV